MLFKNEYVIITLWRHFCGKLLIHFKRSCSRLQIPEPIIIHKGFPAFPFSPCFSAKLLQPLPHNQAVLRDPFQYPEKDL